MSEENIKLWRSVEKTNPAHTKKVNFGRSITAIDPYRQIEAATEAFGAAGKGWGWSIVRVEHLPTNEIGVLIDMWHGRQSNGSLQQWGQASLYIDKAEKKKDTDCLKKATTDGITKCLSCLGFNADIFLGKYDDNKYVQQVTEEFAPKAMTQKEAVESLASAKDMAALGAAWKALPVNLKQDADVAERKELRKSELTTTK